MDYQFEPVVVTPIADGFRVAVKGSVHINVQWLEHELVDVVAAKPKKVELDLGGCEFVSSTGMGTFVKFHRDLTAAGASLEVVAIRAGPAELPLRPPRPPLQDPAGGGGGVMCVVIEQRAGGRGSCRAAARGKTPARQEPCPPVAREDDSRRAETRNPRPAPSAPRTRRTIRIQSERQIATLECGSNVIGLLAKRRRCAAEP